jgi:hypothetical protein
MEENQAVPLFGLGIDPSTKAQLSETARWAKFLAILGFVMMGLAVLLFVFAGTFFATLGRGTYRSATGELNPVAQGFAGAFQFIFLILMVAVYFFPCLFLYLFANRMKTALAANDQQSLNSSFQNLKKFFRFIGILTIILLSFYAVIIFSLLSGAWLGSR